MGAVMYGLLSIQARDSWAMVQPCSLATFSKLSMTTLSWVSVAPTPGAIHHRPGSVPSRFPRDGRSGRRPGGSRAPRPCSGPGTGAGFPVLLPDRLLRPGKDTIFLPWFAETHHAQTNPGYVHTCIAKFHIFHIFTPLQHTALASSSFKYFDYKLIYFAFSN